MFSNPKVRLGLYGLTSALGWLLPLLVGFGAITTEQGGAVTNIIGGIGVLVGIGGGVAASKTSGQIKDGVPIGQKDVAPVSSVSNAITAISGVTDEFTNLVNEVIGGVSKVQEVAGGLTQYLPGSQQVIAALPGSVAEQILGLPHDNK